MDTIHPKYVYEKKLVQRDKEEYISQIQKACKCYKIFKDFKIYIAFMTTFGIFMMILGFYDNFTVFNHNCRDFMTICFTPLRSDLNKNKQRTILANFYPLFNYSLSDATLYGVS
jgi:hypothetical protein